ncbi:MAG: asparagine synthase (glutamine-hydrolyzing), partial [Bacteroidetes bacterium]|nr:asparagine synthase (glutamine-hydrolyzing) [Bacteroidota bacterium]
MCGIVGIAGSNIQPQTLEAMLAMQHHRGPDNTSVFITDDRHCGFGHNRLSIIDLSPEANQPRHDDTGRYSMVFNGEIYNYLEIRNELKNDFHFKTNGDSEVLLCAYKKWGADCLHKLIGMFSIAIWDKDEKTLFAARDRFGVKPFNYAVDADKNFYFSSEIKALFAAGIPKITNEKAWAEYLALGRYDHDENTFWQGIKKLPAGSFMIWKGGDFTIKQWYFLEKETGTEFSTKSIEEVTANYFELLKHTIRLRFRADVPVGINLSGGLDSSALLAMVNAAQGEDNDVKAFTFITGDDQYDELKWVEEMINKTHHPLVPCLLRADEVPALAEKVQYHQDEPFGGMPTLAYSKIFETARQMGVIVLLDGQGMDEQWAGYDYYRKANTTLNTPTVQGTNSNAVLMDTLQPNFTEMVGDFVFPEKYPDLLRNLQYRDSFYT